MSICEAAVLFQGARQKGFASRAQSNKAKNEAPQGVRERLARMPVASIGSHHLQELLNQMDTVGYAGATRRQEIAILSAFFTYAMNIWNWSLPANPALKIEWPMGNERERILTEDETVRLATHLANCGNKPFQIYVLLAMETAMRRGEMLWTMCWCDIDRHAVDGDVLKLPTAKAGRRDVPLTPYALELLGQLPHGEAHERIFDMTEAALENAWKRVCEKAGIVDLHIHDLRRCSATNYAKLLDGNIFSLQKITGHRTLEKLRTYVNLSARDVAKQLRKIPQQTIAQTMQQTMADARSQKIPKARVRKGARPEDGDTGTASGRVYDFGAFRTQALGRAKAGG